MNKCICDGGYKGEHRPICKNQSDAPSSLEKSKIIERKAKAVTDTFINQCRDEVLGREKLEPKCCDECAPEYINGKPVCHCRCHEPCSCKSAFERDSDCPVHYYQGRREKLETHPLVDKAVDQLLELIKLRKSNALLIEAVEAAIETIKYCDGPCVIGIEKLEAALKAVRV